MAFGMNFFRKHQGRFLLVIAVFLMVVWFIGGAIQKLLMPERGMGKVFGKEVSNAEYREAANALSVLRLGATAPDSEVWQLIAVLHEAGRLGIRVTADEINAGLRQWVMAVTKEKPENVNNAYGLILRQARASDGEARAAVEKALTEQKLVSMVAGAVIPTDAVTWQEYIKNQLQMKLKTLQVKSIDFISKVAKPSDEQLAAYYKANEATYKIPQTATVEYMAAFKKDYEQLFPIKEEQIQAYYEQQKAEDYLLPPVESSAALESSAAAAADVASTLEAASIGSSAPAVESSEAQYKPLAEVAGDIRAKLAEKAALDAMYAAKIEMDYNKNLTVKQQADKYAVTYSVTEPFSKAEESKLGALAGAIVERDNKGVLDAIFPTPGASIEVAKSPQGTFLFRVTDMKEERQPDLAEVRDRVESDYIKAEADKLAMEEAGKVLDGLKAKGWGEYQNNPAYKIEEGALSQQQKFDALTEAAFRVEKDGFGGPVLGADGAYVFQVIDRKEPDVVSFNNYKGMLKSVYGMQQQQTFVEAWRKDLVERAKITKTAGGGGPAPSPYSSGYGY